MSDSDSEDWHQDFMSRVSFGPNGYETHYFQQYIPKKVKKHCTSCGLKVASAAKKFSKCSGCLIARYCSKKCQSDDWETKYHRKVCMKAQSFSMGKSPSARELTVYCAQRTAAEVDIVDSIMRKFKPHGFEMIVD